MIKETIKRYSKNDRISLLIRHGDREKIPEGSFGNEVLLNEKGKHNAISFGKDLMQFKLNKILTSPIERCVQTAEHIMMGYGNRIEIIETTALGAPGLHINDEKAAGKFMIEYGVNEMYKRFIQGMEIPGVPTISRLNNLITSYIVDKTSENGITVFVTHDLLIAFYHYSINKTVYTKDNWVKYLMGLTLTNGKHEK